MNQNYSNRGGMSITPLSFHDLLFYHLSVISRTSGNILAMGEELLHTGMNPKEAYWLSVATLDSFLSPIWDDTYKTERNVTGDPEKAARNLLSACMKLLSRKGLLEDQVAEGEV